MSNFYAGDCERCGEYSADRDCAFNPSTGEEIYVCPECFSSLNEED